MRLIAKTERYNNVTVNQLVLLPQKPPTKVRNRRPKAQNLFELDDSFVPFDADGDIDPNLTRTSTLRLTPPGDYDADGDQELEEQGNNEGQGGETEDVEFGS